MYSILGNSTCTCVHESETGISLHVHVHLLVEFPRILKYTSHVHVHVSVFSSVSASGIDRFHCTCM